MKIGLVGFGKMGQEIFKIAQNRGHKITEIIDPRAKESNCKKISQKTKAEVFIDFSTPNSVEKNILDAIAANKNIVVGTTGWTEKLPEIKQKIKKSNIGMIWGSNFSPGVQFFFKIARAAAKIANLLPDFDPAILEMHHREKIDSPSGTALTLAEILVEEIDRKNNVLLDRPMEKVPPDSLHLASIRAGNIPGIHSAIFDSLAETVEIRCTSRSRCGFALGAVLAAEFLQKKFGFFSFPEIFSEIIKKT